MLIIPPVPFRKNRKALKSSASAVPPPVQGPVLIGAGFDAGSGKLELDFDRDVSVAGVVPSAIVVNDPGSGSMYHGGEAEVFGGSVVVVQMAASGSSSGSQTWMSASAANGIVSSDDGTPWAGVSELGLPFP